MLGQIKINLEDELVHNKIWDLAFNHVELVDLEMLATASWTIIVHQIWNKARVKFKV